MHDLDRVLLEAEYGEESGDELEQLAYEVLDITDEAELDEFIGSLIRTVGRGAGRAWNSSLARAVRPHLKAAVATVLPKAAPQLGGYLGGRVGRADLGRKLGNAVAAGAKSYWNLEGEVADDVALARELVEASFEVAQRASSLAGSMPPQQAAARAMQQAIAARSSVSTLTPASDRSGRWVRRGNTIVIKGLR